MNSRLHLYALCVAAASMLAPVAARAQECPEVVPDDCLTLWQAHGRGWLTVTSSGSRGEAITFTNTGPYPVCLDERGLYTSAASQSFYMDDAVLAAAIELAPGATTTLYYGSWTTANGYYQPYYGRNAWWCVEGGQAAAKGATYDWYGEEIPSTVSYWTDVNTDTDGDGRYDLVDWAGSYGVKANYNIWSFQGARSILTIGKLAEADGSDVQVTLTARNLGYYAGSGVVTDTIPAGWTMDSPTASPTSTVVNADGSTTVTWNVTVSGSSGSAMYSQEISYYLVRSAASDAPYLELPEASVYYNDRYAWQTSYSMPAAAWNVDVNGDGVVSCAAPEVCDGVDNDLDGDIDEGFGDSDADGVCDGIDVEECDGADNDGDGETDEGFDPDGDGFVTCFEECVVQEVLCSDEDGLNVLEDGSPAVLTYDDNPRWTARIAGAQWIWDEAYETQPGSHQIWSIFRSFTLPTGAYDLSAVVEMGADNSYHAWLNGDLIGEDATEFNYFAPTDIWDATDALQEGTNTLEFEVWNWAQPGGSAYSNPGGVIYCTTIEYSYEMDPETCDGVDNDCDGLVDEGVSDVDGDGVCDPYDLEECDGADNDGDGAIDEGFDADGDGLADCYDAEECDGLDNDGDGAIDEGMADTDGDGTCDALDVEECDGLDNDGDGAIDEGLPDADGDGVCDGIDVEECDFVDNDGDGEVDEGFDADGDGYTSCGSVSGSCDVLMDIAHAEDTWSDPYGYGAYHGWGDAMDALLSDGLTWTANDTDNLSEATFAGYEALIVAEPMMAFDTDEVNAILDYVYQGGGLLLATDFNPENVNPIANALGVTYNGYADLLGWVGIDTWDTGHPVSSGIDSVFWAYGSTFTVSNPDVRVLGTYGGDSVYAVLEYGAGRVVFSADNELFAGYGWYETSDPNPAAERDNKQLWSQTMGWLADCGEDVPADCDDTAAGTYPGAAELCDGIDNDCDGYVDEGFDSDADGLADCYDVEECDGADNDGDGATDEGFDADADGLADCYDVEECDGKDNDGDGATDEGFDSDVDGTADCYDVEECDGADNDGDGATDEGFDSDADGTADCYDVEECDGTDNDGDGEVDEGLGDADGDGTCDLLDTEECDGLDNDGDGDTDEGFDADADGTADCYDAEECDGLDNDGDGDTDEGFDADADGTADCYDAEECDGLDNNGDGEADEDEVCGCDEFVPTDCLTVWQAHARGWLGITSSGSSGAVISLTNNGPYDICIDTVGLYTSTRSQPFFLDADVAEDDTRIVPGGHLDTYYASWTTPNGVYAPYLGLPGWWCYTSGIFTSTAVPFDFWGEQVPEAMAYFTDAGTDDDNNGTADILEWQATYGTKAQYNLWAYQQTHAILTAGKLAEAYGTGIQVTLTSRNIGWLDGAGTLTDTIPVGWTAGSFSVEPDSVTTASDGATVVTWDLALLGMAGGTSAAMQQVTYVLTRDAGSDAPYTELPEATVAYTEVEGDETNWSMPAAVYNLDVDGDGALACPETEVCDGQDNDLDGLVDDGFDADDDGVADCFDAEECDGLDNDGDGEVDEGMSDVDADGTCDLLDAETCDAIDNDGDGEVDEDEVCGCEEFVPADCLTLWQAEARGWLEIASNGTSGALVTFTNSGPYDICIDEQALYTSEGTQAFYPDGAVVSAGTRILAGGTTTLYYGSWTTANGYYQPYYGRPAWWCVESGQNAAAGFPYDYFGEEIPDVLADWTEAGHDTDADGRDDLVDWAGTYGVQANYNVWAYQQAHAVLTAGKVAEASGAGILVTLTSRNIGWYDGVGVLTDTIPTGWTASGFSTAPDTEVGGTLTWNVSLAGTAGGLTLDMVQVTYLLTRTAGSDAPYTELPEAFVAYDEVEGPVVAYSLPAAVYNLDVDGDGLVTCPETEVCDGIDNDLDGLVDDGFDSDNDELADCFDTEECDAQDNDGDGDIDEAMTDTDIDGLCDALDLEECDGLDNDGDGTTDEGFDTDVDGTADCFDVEECDGLDNNGDGATDEGFDTDLDGLADCFDVEECDGLDNDGDGATDEGFDSDVDGTADCFDVEECDGVDNDGDSAADEGFDTDVDGTADCFDVEECDGADNDGDGATDEGFDTDADGTADCFDAETCDGVDNDGDAVVDEGFDSDADGTADCYDTEACDGVDNDGDLLVDEGFDADGDGTSDCFDTEVCDTFDNDGDGEVNEGGVCGTGDCPEVVPTECLSVWQAHARGWLQVSSSGYAGSKVTFTNVGGYPVCLDEAGLYTSDASQAFHLDDAVVDLPVRIEPGATFSAYYGSWTTDNGYYSAYLGEPAWWCVESGQDASSGATFDWYGERIPDVLYYWSTATTDEDGDGVADDLDWAGTYGVQSQYNAWTWQQNHGVLTMGKMAETAGTVIQVTLTTRNVGYDDASGTVQDTIPAGWTIESVSLAPTSVTYDSTGQTLVSWDVAILGTAGGLSVWGETITYTISRDAGSDAPYTELPEASVDYAQVEGLQTSYSMPAAIYNLDVNGDGAMDCPTDEVCDGVDNDLDGQVDEGIDVDGDGTADCFDVEECDGVDNDGDGEVDEVCPGSISGVLWLDMDSNGSQNCIEPGIENVTVTATGPDCDGDGAADVLTTVTDEDGLYLFDETCIGTWTVAWAENTHYDDPTTPNPVTVTMEALAEEVVDFGTYRCFAFHSRAWWISYASKYTWVLPLNVGSTSYTTSSAVTKALKATPTNARQILAREILVAKLNVEAFGIGPFPVADLDGDGDIENVAWVVGWAEDVILATLTSYYTTLTKWLQTLYYYRTTYTWL